VSGSLAILLGLGTAQANTITKEEAGRFYSLRQKLRTLSSDVNQSSQQVVGNNPAFWCLNLISTQAQLVEAVQGHVGELVMLASVMRDEGDELVVLHELRIIIPVGVEDLAETRQTINKAMGSCPDVSTANVKGQAILGVFTEMNEFLKSLFLRIPKVPN
jgi:hypothetical protein